jgi:hypothetical protein
MASPTITGVTGAVVTGTGFADDYRTNLQKEYLLDGDELDFTETNITFETGLYNKAWSFNGTSSKATASNNQAWSNKSLFASFWLKIPVSGFGNKFIFNNNLLGNGWYLFINNDGLIQMLVQDRASPLNFSFFNSNVSMNTGWNYIEFWYRDNAPDITYGICINRGTDQTQSVAFNIGDVNMGTLNFGTFSGSGQFLLAEVDRLRFYSSATPSTFLEIPNATQRNLIYNAPAFYIEDTFTLSTINSGTEATLASEPTAGNTVYVYNREGSDSFLVESSAKPKLVFTYDSTEYEFTPPLYGYESTIKHDWTVVTRSDLSKGIYDAGATYDIYQCRVSFLLPESEVDKLLTLYASSARGEEVVLTCSDGFFPFSPFRGDGEFTVRIVDLQQGGRRLSDRYPITLTLVNVGAFPAYTPSAGVAQGILAIGTATGLPYPKNNYSPKIEYNLTEQILANQVFVNSNTTDSFETDISLDLNTGKCASLVSELLTKRTGNTTITAGTNHYIFGYEKGDGSYTTKRISPEIKIVHASHNKFLTTAGYKWLS